MDTYLSMLESKPTDPNMHIINKSFFSPSFLTGFIKKYQSLVCLWNVKCPDYSNNTARQNSWENLTDFCRSLFPNADVLWVKKKVANMRGSIRKELKKIKQAPDVYKPRLWYFDLLSFIRDVETAEAGDDSDGDEDDGMPPNVGCIQILQDNTDSNLELLDTKQERMVRNAWFLFEQGRNSDEYLSGILIRNFLSLW